MPPKKRKTAAAPKPKRVAVSSEKAPGNIAPYSQAMYADNLLFVSGQLGMTAEGKFEATDAAGQTAQALKKKTQQKSRATQSDGLRPPNSVKPKLKLGKKKPLDTPRL